METSVYSNVLALSLMFTVAAAAHADRTVVPLTDPARPVTIKVSLLEGSITVKGADRRDVLVEAEAEVPRGPAQKGTMKRIPMDVTGLTIEEENNVVDVSARSPSDVRITVPTRSSLHLRTVSGGDIVVSGVDGEIDASNVSGSVTLRNVSGTAVAHALSGKVLVVFDRINPQKPMAFSSLYGDIDVTFPADLKANVTVAVDNGDVFSDFDLQLESRSADAVPTGKREGGKYRVKFEKAVRGTINGGGQQIQFKTFQGSVYIRKAGSR